MELFRTAGIDLPPGDGKGNRKRATLRTLRVPLFNYKVVGKARERIAFAPSSEQVAAAKEYARKVKNPKFLKQKETSVRGVFIQDVLQIILGYRAFDPAQAFTLAIEKQTRTGPVDVALGRFTAGEGIDELVAPFELKGPGNDDLDKIEAGRRRSPVQQAWDYAVDTPGAHWVLVSNCIEVRLYGFGRGRDAYELFDLTRLDDPEEHARLWLVLSAESLLGTRTNALLRDTDSAYKDVTDELYRQYKQLRERLIAYMTGDAEGPKLTTLRAIEPAQKILDRVLFIAFAQRTDLLPDRLLEDAAKDHNRFVPQPIWANFLALFRAIDAGNNRLAIWADNGGLFAKDAVADDLIIPDDLARDIAGLGGWDYGREVPVTVLGHLFEQSITDIERLKAESKGEAPPRVSKRKREGVVYTPDAVTRFLVERTVGLTLDQRRAALEVEHGIAGADLTAKGLPPGDELGFWQGYLDTLRSLTVVDPACGSGAFLVAAFDELARRYRDAVGRLLELGVEPSFDIFDEIVTRNLYGVDLNPESVEITRLSLWLKTARRDHRLQNLEATIKCGNSLIDDAGFTDRAFDWRTAFPEVFANGGFDVVIGNPPYVRMEYLKPIKPYLERYVVAADRADLYAYFFEKGVGLLKPGGRLGFISSSTFFRTGSGENLRVFLTDGVEIECVVDFGEVQLFAGITTYPAILTLAKGNVEAAGDLYFINVKDGLPADLGQAFEQGKGQMPRARLGRGSWRFEKDALALLRDKIAAGRKTLGEVYGPPLYGIKTGLNEAFVIDRATRDSLVAADPKSAELLEPFVIGENIKRWRIESDDLFLINTPRGKVDIEVYPAVRDWLLPLKSRLEKRATKQQWWELQQSQLSYHSRFKAEKIVFLDIANKSPFCLDRSNAFIDCTVFMIENDVDWMLAYLNSKAAWFQLFGQTPIASGGYIRLKAQYVSNMSLPLMPSPLASTLATFGQLCTDIARERFSIQSAVRHRMLDLAGPNRRKLTGKLERWHELDFAGFLAEVGKAFGADVPIKRRGEWEAYLADHAEQVRDLTANIAAAENEIDALVFQLFDLTTEEIELIDATLAEQR